ncbi:hypothetical protein CC1G_03274 [Coprinopsis cinerea okayama7|uniref:Uncharacterized protein n=1 Tax=Coprinopsis cinerea (strain Okayama-7 / 130 / ATCC MYA-4618 / FGSC 9003) TaxID=240176 RepID=A8N7D1_COPC7|nr:hypothetical protein CC1G_03274 [Coprinopsis cinerea okayama7\|eukprot:XP_001830737.2 hypothetical protein CC1G_03274 [Coprinopsis cinerea okayama7\
MLPGKADEFAHAPEGIEELGYTMDERHSHGHEARDRQRRGSISSKKATGSWTSSVYLNPKYLLKEVGSRRKRFSKSIWGVLVFYVILLCLCVVAFAVVSRLYERMMLRVYTPQRVIPLAAPARPLDKFYSDSLECFGTPVRNTNLQIIPVSDEGDHSFNLVGGAFAEVTLASSPDSQEKNVVYDMTLGGKETPAVSFDYTSAPNTPTSVTNGSFFNVSTPLNTEESTETQCTWTRITIFIPRSLKKLSIFADANAQMTVSPGAHIELDELVIDLVSQGRHDSVLNFRESLQARNLSIRSEGWISGSLSLVDNLSISQNTNKPTKLDIVPSAPLDMSSPSPAVLETRTSGGDMDLTYRPAKEYRRRPIRSSHVSTSPEGETVLRYAPANFSGPLALQYSSLDIPEFSIPLEEGVDVEGKDWTHYYGARDGVDTLQYTPISPA